MTPLGPKPPPIDPNPPAFMGALPPVNRGVLIIAGLLALALTGNAGVALALAAVLLVAAYVIGLWKVAGTANAILFGRKR